MIYNELKKFVIYIYTICNVPVDNYEVKFSWNEPSTYKDATNLSKYIRHEVGQQSRSIESLWITKSIKYQSG